tara:strand:+ start:134 stop:355 length:222 start_codon:yes stop_codon:yes gene_type:complete
LSNPELQSQQAVFTLVELRLEVLQQQHPAVTPTVQVVPVTVEAVAVVELLVAVLVQAGQPMVTVQRTALKVAV